MARIHFTLGGKALIRQQTTDECSDCRRDYTYVQLKKIEGVWICPECRWLRLEAKREAEYA